VRGIAIFVSVNQSFVQWCLSLLFQLRGIAIYVSVNQYFDYLVMLTILANCAFLAMTEPINEAE
jgi:hypothetical protein